jgi:hypothetical protein
MAGVMTYDPSVDTIMSAIPPQEPNLNEEIARAALNRQVSENKQPTGPPTGLLRTPLNEPEKDVVESQMADFATPIEEVMPGPGQMMQDEVMGSAYAPQKAGSHHGGGETQTKSRSKNPFGLQDEQYQALLAGVAAVVAFSKPVQSKLGDMVPKFHGPSGDVSLTGLAVTALVAAIVFYLAKKYLVDGQ